MSRLRYTGQQPVSFMAFPYLGEVAPGEFEARDDDVEALLSRADIEDPNAVSDSESDPEPPAGTEVTEPAKAPAKARSASASKTPQADVPAATDPATTA